MIFSSVFTGGGGADIGARDADFELGDGLEIDASIAKVANDNLGGHVHVGDILTTDPSLFKPMDLFHASPPCPNFSVAKAGASESWLDIALASKVCDFIRYHKPRLFTLENVMGYRKSKSYALIISALAELGYMYDAQILNSADFGVPQTRRRLIVRASRIGLIPKLPDPVKWVGWYEAIEDLIPTLPESKFADWQLSKLRKINDSTIFNNQASDDHKGGSYGITQREKYYPSITISTSFVPKAWISDMQNVGRDLTIRETQEPFPTVSASMFRHKALLVNESSTMEVRQQQQPATTQIATGRGGGLGQRMLENGRVVSMTPRALARFQSIPDWYQLPDKKLACKIIGNIVPPLMYQHIAKGLLETL